MPYYVYFLIGFSFVFGFICKFIFDSIHNREKPIGSLKVNDADPDGPYLFLEIDDPNWRSVISKKKEIRLRVNIDQ